MMKKKGFNGLLIVGVILIWVFVFRKTTNFFGNDTIPLESVQNTGLATISHIEFKKDTFKIQGFERDPFLDTPTKPKVIIQKKLKVSKPSTVKRAKNKKTPQTKWPKLQYYGFIKGGDETKKLALIKINNKLNRVREKESVEDIQISKVYKDSVVLKMNGQIKTLKK